MINTLLSRLVPNQITAIWVGLLVTFLVFGDFERLWSRRNFSLAALFLVAPFLVDIMPRSRSEEIGGMFTAIYLTTAFYALWGLTLAFRRIPDSWAANLNRRILVWLIVFLFVLNAALVICRPPDDCGVFTNLGAGRWMETGTLPYGDPKLRGPKSPAIGAAAAYGPLLYAAHVPFQWLLGVKRNSPESDPRARTYVFPPVLATKLACLTFYVLGLIALFKIVERPAGREVALGAIALYVASPYVIGLGGEKWVATGLRFISHIAPSSVILLAYLALDTPFLAGMLLAAAAGVLFYPAFLFPAWFGWYLWRGRGALRFAGGFLLVGTLLATMVIALTRAPGVKDAVAMFLESTLETQEGRRPLEYGASTFGFWGTHPELASFWQTPLYGSTSLFKPTFLLYGTFCAITFFLAGRRSQTQLAGLTAALAAAVQLWKTHAGGTYVEWYFPFLLIALFAHRAPPPAATEGTPTPSNRLD